jgi:hypothetical protein
MLARRRAFGAVRSAASLGPQALSDLRLPTSVHSVSVNRRRQVPHERVAAAAHREGGSEDEGDDDGDRDE